MRFISKSICVICCTCIAFSGQVAVAETIPQQNARVLTAHEEAFRELNTKLDTLLAQAQADRTARRYEGEQGQKDAGQVAVALDGKMDNVIETIEELPETAVSPDLKKKMLTCAKAVKDELAPAIDAVKSGQAPDISQTALSCDQAEFKAILDELERHKQDTLKAWNQCRETLLKADAIVNTDIPVDPSGISRDDKEGNKQLTENLKLIAERSKSLGPDVQACGDQLGDLYDQMRNQEDAAAAMAMAMNMVATVCAASGGNPYVCGGAFLIAILASLFSDGGGDGDGDGDSDGTGEKGDGSNALGTGTVAGPAGPSKPHEADNKGLSGGIKPGKKKIPGPGGDWACVPEIADGVQTINCRNTKDSMKSFSLASNRFVGNNKNVLLHFKNLANLEDGYVLWLCAGSKPATMIDGILIYQPDGRYLPVPAITDDLTPEQYKLGLSINLKALDGKANEGKHPKHCANVGKMSR